MSDWQGFSPLNDFTGPLLDNLKRHPKRIVFPEGEDVRVLRVSQRFVEEQAGAPILLGRREVITRMAEMNGISLKFVRIIEPEKSSDLQMFCDRYERAEQMFGNGLPINTREIVSEPVHFASPYGARMSSRVASSTVPGMRVVLCWCNVRRTGVTSVTL